MLDVLIVSLGSTGGLRRADEELLASLRRAGASAQIALAAQQPQTRTLMLTDLRWALAARRAAQAALASVHTRAVIYSTTTAALLWPRPGAIRFDAPAAANRPGRHGAWQRPFEHRRLLQAPLLIGQSEGALLEMPAGVRRSLGPDGALVLPVPVEPSMAFAEEASARAGGADVHGGGADVHGGGTQVRDIAAITYAANPSKKGLDVLLSAWARVRREGEELVVAGVEEPALRRLGYALPAPGVSVVGMLPPADYRALLARARIYVCAARREDYGIAQLEALADGCMLVTVPSPGPYAALALARRLDERLVDDDLGVALRTALDDPAPHYSQRAAGALEPFRRESCDRLVAEELLPRLLRRG
jgi:glycosyltransferase involved in cell wall biosynthesis